MQAERVETALHTVLGENRRVVVGGMPDATFGEQVVAVIEGEDSAEIDPTALLQSGQLHRYELPRQIIFLPHFSETRSGKVDRQTALRYRCRQDGSAAMIGSIQTTPTPIHARSRRHAPTITRPCR